MVQKTHKSAAVLIPSSAIWDPIQDIRKHYDRHYHRWMPHINLLYPFLNPNKFQDAAVKIKKALDGFEPFRLSFKEMSYFKHREDAFTFWLKPEPAKPIHQLQQKMLELFPNLDDTARHKGGYTPHLTLGQNYYSETNVQSQVDQLMKKWEPIEWTVEKVFLIWRNDLPDDDFRIGQEIRL